MSAWSVALTAARREASHIRNSGWDLALLFPLPVLAMVVIAAVFSAGTLRDIPIGLVDMDGSGLARTITRDLLSAPKVKVVATPRDLTAAGSLLRSGRVYALVYLPPGLERAARTQASATVPVYFNSAFQTAGSQAADAAEAAVKAAVEQDVGKTEGPHGATVAIQPPTVQVTVVGNAPQSFELFLNGLITPLTLNVLLACAVVFAFGRELGAGALADLAAVANGRWAAAVLGKAAPYVIVYFGWMAAWTAWLAGCQGWGVKGDPVILLLAQAVLLASTATLSAAIVALTRKPDTALSLAALVFGSGLSFAGGTLPVANAPLFTQLWSAVLPSTSYVRIQEQQLVLGSSAARSAIPLLVLLGFFMLPLLYAAARFKALAASPPKAHELTAPPPAPGFLASFRQTLKVVFANEPILATLVASVVIYGFYYPMAYKVQTVVQLPVAVADLDRSPWSRAFLRHLGDTREMRITTQTESAAAAQRLLREDRVDAVIVIPHGLEANLLKGSPGGVAAYLKGAYLVRVKFLGHALSDAVQASLTDAIGPMLGAGGRPPPPTVKILERPLYNVANGYGGYAVPGVASVILQATLLFGVAMFMGLRRERDTWRMAPSAFFGVWAAFTLLGALTALFWFGFVLWFQDLPRAGDLPGLLLCVPLFSAAVSAMALCIGSLFERHERSMQILAGTSIPFFFLAGLSWPSFAMPAVVRGFADLLPSTAAVSLFVKLNSMSAGLTEVFPEISTLAILTAGYGLLAFWRLAGSPPSRSYGLDASLRTRAQGDGGASVHG